MASYICRLCARWHRGSARQFPGSRSPPTMARQIRIPVTPCALQTASCTRTCLWSRHLGMRRVLFAAGPPVRLPIRSPPKSPAPVSRTRRSSPSPPTPPASVQPFRASHISPVAVPNTSICPSSPVGAHTCICRFPMSIPATWLRSGQSSCLLPFRGLLVPATFPLRIVLSFRARNCPRGKSWDSHLEESRRAHRGARILVGGLGPVSPAYAGALAEACATRTTSAGLRQYQPPNHRRILLILPPRRPEDLSQPVHPRF